MQPLIEALKTLSSEIPMSKLFKFGLVEFELTQSSSDIELDFEFGTFWNSYASGLVSLTYSDEFKSQKQAVLDALSPFQLASKTWAKSVLEKYDAQSEPHVVYHLGAWYGQLAAMMLASASFSEVKHVLIDRDPVASQAQRVLFGSRSDLVVSNSDALSLRPSQSRCNVVVWSGLEHFPEESIKSIASHVPSGTRVLIQGTSLPDDDHVTPIDSLESLKDRTHYFHDSQILYSGELKTNFGSRFMLVLQIE